MPTEEILNIEKLVYGGDGLARLDGKVILLPGVLPGEAVRAEVERVKNDLFRGRVLELITTSPSRVSPPCPYFSRCGGCQYQHAAYEFQVDQKREILREALRRVGKIDFDGEIDAVTAEPWQYRNRVQLHVDHGAVGYFRYGSHKLCAIDQCPISSPRLNEAIAQLNALAPQLRSFTGGIELFTNETDIQVNVLDRAPRAALSAIQSLGVSGPIEYSGFRVSRNSFFQVNRFLIDRLVDVAIGNATGNLALDLYAGVGLFAAHLAACFKEVIAVESSKSAYQDLEYNIGKRELRVAAENKATEDYLVSVEGTPDIIVADPPRAGLGKRATRELTRIRVPKVVIVSCDPATLARDLKELLSAYRIEKITLVDLFPQTFHIETVVHLSAQ